MRIYFCFRLQQFAPLLLVVAGASLAVAAYLQALNYPFLSDDALYVTYQRLADLPLMELWRLLLEPYNPSREFLPLRDLSYWIDISMFGQDPAPYRLHNIILYLLCLPLLYAVTENLWCYFYRTAARQAPWVAAVVTALFAMHPALVESVVWIAGRKYILPDFFSLLSILLAVKARRDTGLSSCYAAAALLALAATMLSKSSYAGVAPIIAMLWLRFWLDFDPSLRRRSTLLWPCSAVLLALFLLLVFIAHNAGFDSVPPYFGTEAIVRSLAILGGLMRISAALEPRHFYYPLFEDPWFPVMVVLGMAMLVITVCGSWLFLRQRSFPGFTLSAFLLLCLPYLQLVPACPPSLIADRYVALAVWPIILLLAVVGWRLRPLLRASLFLALSFLWLSQTMEHPRDWRDVDEFIEHDLRAYPDYYVPVSYKVVLQLQAGLRDEAKVTASRVTLPGMRDVMLKLVRADAAVNAASSLEAMYMLLELERLLEQPPPESRWNTPIIFTFGTLQSQLAREWLLLSGSFPDEAPIRYSAGAYLLHMQKYQEAEDNLRAAIALPGLPDRVRGTARKNLGLAMLGKGHYAEAEKQLRLALEQSSPDAEAYCILSDLNKRRGWFAEAVRDQANCRSVAAPGGKFVQ